MRYRAQEQAGGRLAGDNRRATLASLQEGGTGIEPQAGQGHPGGMATPAIFFEDPDRGFRRVAREGGGEPQGQQSD